MTGSLEGVWRMGAFTKSAVLCLVLAVSFSTPSAAQQEATGEIIADLEIPGTQTSLPMTYMHEDEQYVVFTVGGGGQPAQLIAMTLP